MKISWKTFLLILLQLFLLNGLFVFRYPAESFPELERQAKSGQFETTILDRIKLYYSQPYDEHFYYGWSSVVLGKAVNPYKRGRGNRELSFQWPYLDVPFQYPPLLIVPILAARVMSDDYLSFTRTYALIVSLIYFIGLWIAYGIWRRLDPKSRLSWPMTLLWATLSILALGQLYVTRADVFPSVLYLLAIYAFVRERYQVSAVWIALGVFAKAYAIILAPLFGLVLLRQKKYRQLFLALGIVVGLVVGINLLLGIITDGAYWDSIRYHSERGIQAESLYALVPYLGHWFFDMPIRIYVAHSCLNIAMPHNDMLLTVSNILPFVVLGGALCAGLAGTAA